MSKKTNSFRAQANQIKKSFFDAVINNDQHEVCKILDIFNDKSIGKKLKIFDTYINSRNDFHQTALMLAASYGHKGIAQKLLQNRTSADFKEAAYFEAIEEANIKGQVNIAKIIKSHIEEILEIKNEDIATLNHYGYKPNFKT